MKISSEQKIVTDNSNIYSYLYGVQTETNNPYVNKGATIFPFRAKSSSSRSLAEIQADELKLALDEVKNEQGFIGKAWDGIKGLFGGGSKKIEKQIEQYKKGEISYEEVQKSVEGYKEGQKMSVDVVADLASGIVSVMAFALAVPTGGASLVAGAVLAATVGAGVKIGLKAADAYIGGRDYTSKDFWYDTATGAINGLLAPITNGIGACVTKSIGQKFGLSIVKEGTEELIEQGAKASLKSLITSQGVKVSGGSLATRAVATGAGMAVDGSLGGAADNAVRAAMNGENIIDAAVQGAVGGLIMAPVIGGGFKVAGKVGHALNNKLTVNSILPDAANISFGQGVMGDCALLSTLDGMFHNPQTLQKIQKSITQSIDGSYNVTIGGRTVKVMRDALTDEMLSDKTGIRIFEQAYKQLAGELDGGFADVVAKQFGLNPVHINPASITDDTLDLLAREKGNGIFSFGTKVDANGNIALDGTNHYFSIREIDPVTKKVIVTDPYNTAKTIELSYDDVKRLAVSIDGGTIKTSEILPSVLRNPEDLPFYGYTIDGRFVRIPRESASNVNSVLEEVLIPERDFYFGRVDVFDPTSHVLQETASDEAAAIAKGLKYEETFVNEFSSSDYVRASGFVTKNKARYEAFNDIIRQLEECSGLTLTNEQVFSIIDPYGRISKYLSSQPINKKNFGAIIKLLKDDEAKKIIATLRIGSDYTPLKTLIKEGTGIELPDDCISKIIQSFDTKTLTIEDIKALKCFKQKGLTDEHYSRVLEFVRCDKFNEVVSTVDAEFLNRYTNASRAVQKAEAIVDSCLDTTLKNENKHSRINKIEREVIGDDGVPQKISEYEIFSDSPEFKKGVMINESVLSEKIVISQKDKELYDLLCNKYADLLNSGNVSQDTHVMHRLLQRFGKANEQGGAVDFDSIERFLIQIRELKNNPKNLFDGMPDKDVLGYRLGFQMKPGTSSRGGCALIMPNGPNTYDVVIFDRSGHLITTISDIQTAEVDRAFCPIVIDNT